MKRFERSNGMDTALYKNYLYLLPLYRSSVYPEESLFSMTVSVILSDRSIAFDESVHKLDV